MKYIIPFFEVFTTLALLIAVLGYKTAIGIMFVSILAGILLEKAEKEVK